MMDCVYWAGIALGALGVLATFVALLWAIQRMAWALVKELYGWPVLYRILRDHHAKNRKDGEE